MTPKPKIEEKIYVTALSDVPEIKLIKRKPKGEFVTVELQKQDDKR